MNHKAAVLRELFASKPLVRIVGAHNGLGAKLIERHGFDGVWASGLEISTAHAVPDANILTMTEHLAAAQAMNDATALPVVCDCDTGWGNAANVMHMVRKYEAAGLAAVVIEDKQFPKVNSFVPGRQQLAPMEEFMGKVEAAKAAQQDPAFMVFARLEALIAGWGLDEALRRAAAYAEAGADGLVIHSKASSPAEVFAFAARWRGRVPLVVIPTMYAQVTAGELAGHGFKMVIYANHGLRAAIRAMEEVFAAIQTEGSTAGVEGRLASMQEVFELQGMPRMTAQEQRFLRRDRLQVIIPAAGDHQAQQPALRELLADRPLCMLDIGGETLLQRQLALVRSVGATDCWVVGGHRHERIVAADATLLVNPRYAVSHTAASVMLAAQGLAGGRCLIVYADILFDRQIAERLLASPHAITLVIDRAYRTLPFRDKRLDLVLAEDPAKGATGRRLQLNAHKPIRRIGKAVGRDQATHEFIGLVFLREEGLRAVQEAWREALSQQMRPFYEAASVEQASLTDLLQYLIDRGSAVHGLEIEHGWSEIHSPEDYDRVRAHYARAEQVASERAG